MQFESKLDDMEIKNIKDQVLKDCQQLNTIYNNNLSSASSILMVDSIYTGKVRDNQKEGFGECISYNDNKNSERQNKKIKEYYLGEWKDSMKDGFGMMVYSNGNQYDYYVGQFQQNKQHGSGEIKYSTGESYKGEFQNNQFHGKGILILQDQITYYEGDWSFNQRDGFGIEHGIDDNKIWDYQGSFSKGKRQGKGKLTIHNDYEIEGEFENDFPKNAVITYKQQECQADKYDGYLDINNNYESIFHGNGTLTMKNNQIIQGIFSNHEFKGK
ncbi:unnamed protein product (macronuclear) [Paramecium tetraurelia]|uniref:MORN repeat protein n=1 Tax=Paramecium tetraurelia TaxID=5888 RepID=A0CB89_PARTE|nr:uncharacterized protein GSPATT00036839001 [Paramecium tetraurelia]CAK68056.1 unnamed protein product [Paramecium tetraurelia]|eukprot:XP_001435453.1 hypothetical protein (macronuclear) [Paramecium tetraurelia strain d4-2]